MKLIKRFLLIIVGLWITSFVSASERTDSLFAKGDSLYVSQEFQYSLIEYERVLFNGCSKEIKSQILLKKSDCYKQLGLYESAIQELFRIDIRSLNPSVSNKYIYKISLCYYLNHEIDLANIYINLLSENLNGNPTAESALLGLQIKNELAEYELANKYAEDYLLLTVTDTRLRDSLLSSVNELYDSENLPKLKNEKTARTMSFIIPGLGQIYAGYPLNGLLSLALCAGSIYAGGLLFSSAMYVTGAIGGIGLFIKFYFGGISRTTYLVNKKNSQRMSLFNSKVENLVFGFST